MANPESTQYLKTTNDCGEALDCNRTVVFAGYLEGKSDKFIDESTPFELNLYPTLMLDIPERITSSKDLQTIFKYAVELISFEREHIGEVPDASQRKRLSDSWRVTAGFLGEIHQYSTEQVTHVTESDCTRIQHVAQRVQDLYYDQLSTTLTGVLVKNYREAEKKLIRTTISLAEIDQLRPQLENLRSNLKQYQADVDLQFLSAGASALVSILNLFLTGPVTMVVTLATVVANVVIDKAFGLEELENDGSITIERGDQIAIAAEALGQYGTTATVRWGKFVSGSGTAIGAYDTYNDSMSEIETLEKRYNEAGEKLGRLEKVQQELLVDQKKYLQEVMRYIGMMNDFLKGNPVTETQKQIQDLLSKLVTQ